MRQLRFENFADLLAIRTSKESIIQTNNIHELDSVFSDFPALDDGNFLRWSFVIDVREVAAIFVGILSTVE